jgi:Outer membrane protein beta-barrel domain
MKFLRVHIFNLTGLFTKIKPMSRILLSLFIIFFSYSASAQFNKGNILLGGNLSFGSSKSTSPPSPDEQKSNSGNIDISLGKAIKENALFGINLSYGEVSNTFGSGVSPSKSTSYNYGIGVFYRVYKALGKEFYLFGQAGAEFNGSSYSSTDSTGNKLFNGTSYGGSIYISPGIDYRISKKFFLELSIPQIFSINYSNSNSKSGSVSTGTGDNFGISANFISNPLNSLGIGFRLVL